MKDILICMTTRATEFRTTRIFYDNESYFAYVRKGGGVPLVAYAYDEESAALYAERCDGLIVTGGEDSDPALYGEENLFSGVIDTDVEKSDLLLYRAFLKAGKPILGICRGIQLINIAEGGSLIQDIPAQTEDCHEHYQNRMDPPVPVGQTAHDCRFVKGTLMYEIFGETYPVNTYHHQAIKRPAEGFVISAYSDDGLIEAMEKENVTAVQWHPERLSHDEKHMELMRCFLRECSAKKAV